MNSRNCILQLIRTRMASRQAMQRLLKKNGAGITFEMLQVMSCLWSEQGISQQTLAERTSKDKACLTSLMGNLERSLLRTVGKYTGGKTTPANRETVKRSAACYRDILD